MQPVVIRADQHQVGQLRGATVFPMPQVMRVQATAGPTTGHHTRAVAVLQRAAQPPIDHPRGPARPNNLPVTFEPDLTGGITGQQATFGIGQQRTQMQGCRALPDVEVGHHGRVLPMRAAGGLGVPTRLDQPHQRIDGAGQRRPLIGNARAVCLIVFPLGDQRLTMRRQSGVELRRIQVAQHDPITGAPLSGGRSDRTLRLDLGPRFGLGLGL
ncbi:hypothetical protein MINTM021_36690 [Mycobacterium paraintracellulare]|nr:hypothetical protein MINTM021_36690 [Mycobacterium paraintracellulare]